MTAIEEATARLTALKKFRADGGSGYDIAIDFYERLIREFNSISKQND